MPQGVQMEFLRKTVGVVQSAQALGEGVRVDGISFLVGKKIIARAALIVAERREDVYDLRLKVELPCAAVFGAALFRGNEASRRVMEKCGMRFDRVSEKELTYLGVERDLIYYVINRGDI